MPPINAFWCNKCDFAFRGWGGITYVIDDAGERITCPHPGEIVTVREVLGLDAPKELIAARTGFNSDCVCADCLHQFRLDVRRDERKCQHCNSRNVQTVRETVGKICPKCKEGTVEEIETGILS